MPLHLLVKWEVVSPNSREGQLESMSITSSIPLFWFCISNVGGGGGVIFLTFYATVKPVTRGHLNVEIGMSKLHFLWTKIYFNIEMYLWRGDTCHVGTLFEVSPRHRFHCISNISRKQKLGIQTNYFSFNVFFVFFFVCWKYWKVPLHLQLLAKLEVVSPNSRYRAFYHEIGNIQKCPFTYWLNGEVVSPNRRYTCREF